MTTSETNLLPPPSRRPAGSTAPAKTPAASRSESLPRIVTVMCPVGFTPYATEGLTLDRPLFARVTYRRA